MPSSQIFSFKILILGGLYNEIFFQDKRESTINSILSFWTWMDDIKNQNCLLGFINNLVHENISISSSK